MKKLMFIIASILISIGAYGEAAKAQETHKPLVVEGRTWWYESISQIDGPIDYGVTIGKEVDIDDVKWHEVRVVKSMLHGFDGVWHDSKDEDIVVGYIREDGAKVYSMPIIKHSFKPINELTIWLSTDNNVVTLIYDFSSTGTRFIFGNENGNFVKFGFDVTDISEIQNSGIKYNEWTAKYNGITGMGEPWHWIPESSIFKYVEGIGVTQSMYSSMLFYFPWEAGLTGDWDYCTPTLRYVTEGEDNTVIYEGIGGKKLWEIPASVNNVAVDSADSDTEWYTIHGIEVDRPTTSGVYIRRQGGTATKVVVK